MYFVCSQEKKSVYVVSFICLLAKNVQPIYLASCHVSLLACFYHTPYITVSVSIFNSRHIFCTKIVIYFRLTFFFYALFLRCGVYFVHVLFGTLALNKSIIFQESSLLQFSVTAFFVQCIVCSDLGNSLLGCQTP